jgi:hypothetical protein
MKMRKYHMEFTLSFDTHFFFFLRWMPATSMAAPLSAMPVPQAALSV